MVISYAYTRNKKNPEQFQGFSPNNTALMSAIDQKSYTRRPDMPKISDQL